MLHKHYTEGRERERDNERKKPKLKERQLRVVSRIRQQSQRTAPHGVMKPWSKWANPRRVKVATKRTDCPTDSLPCLSVCKSVCPSVRPHLSDPKKRTALPKLTRSKMSDGLIGLNAGKIYLSTLVGFGFCLRSSWSAVGFPFSAPCHLAILRHRHCPTLPHAFLALDLLLFGFK